MENLQMVFCPALGRCQQKGDLHYLLRFQMPMPTYPSGVVSVPTCLRHASNIRRSCDLLVGHRGHGVILLTDIVEQVRQLLTLPVS